MGRNVFDEMHGWDGNCRPAYHTLKEWLGAASLDVLDRRRREAEMLFRRIGITFAVHGDAEAEERLIPFDIIPRVLAAGEWSVLARGLEQRVRALNAFLKDIYGERDILRAGVVPEDLVLQSPHFCPEMADTRVPGDVYVHIAGIDVVRVDDSDFYVLEDNARTPSGVSYMLENREAMLRLFPELVSAHRIAPVENYCDELLMALKSVAPATAPDDPTVALLTPGPFNSAYYEHSFLADRLGVELVEGRDLFVRDEVVHMRTTEGAKRVDVIYRRVDDEFLDPLVFRPDSMLGVAGGMRAYRAGDLTPPHVGELVVKRVDGSGGYGMLVGPHATRAEREAFAERLRAEPQDYIAQPTLALSTCPAYVDSGVAPRHVDLRPFVLSARDRVRIVPGGLTRVALEAGSLVVNSSQGGGAKDTWVLSE